MDQPPVRAFVLSTGSEITQGLYSDTNATEISRRLLAGGARVVGHAAAPDELHLICGALRHARSVADLVIVTGGIGPTEDDLTRDAVAQEWGVPLRTVHRAAEMIRHRFRRRGYEMPPRNLKQATVPANAQPLLNFWGTAPGFFIPPRDGAAGIAAFPGVPYELRQMLDRYLERDILAAWPARPLTSTYTFHLCGAPESTVNELVSPLFGREPGVDVGILASRGQIRVRAIVTAPDAGTRDRTLERIVDEVAGLLPPELVYARGEAQAVPIEAQVVAAFRNAGNTIALAESCTGGGIAKRLTDIPGASGVLLESAVTYSNASKIQTLGVSSETIGTHGAVSRDTVAEMAAGQRRRTGADVAVATSGIAGPGGGTAAKPVGLVWFAIADADGVQCLERHFPGDRDHVRWWSEVQGLDLLRRWVSGLPMPPGTVH